MGAIDRLLGFLGRHATWVLFGGVFLGLAVPPLAALARPLLAPAVVAMLMAMLLRIDWRAMGAYARRPGLAAVLVAWMLVLTPVAAWAVAAALGLPPALTTAIVLMAAAPPILSAAAIALLLGLDGALAIVASLAATALAPLTVPPLAELLLGVHLQIGVGAFMARLAALVAVAFAGAALVRRLAPPGWLAAHGRHVDGAVVVLMLVFAVAIMDGVTARAIAEPGRVALWVVAAFLANPALQVVAAGAFAWLGRRGALTVGLTSGNRNMGLLLAAMPPAADFDVLLFFAVGQLPIFMLPAVTAPLYRRLLAAGARR